MALVSAIPAEKALAGDAGSEGGASLVVTATRHEMPQSQVSSDIMVITKEEIAHLPVHDVGEVLNYTTGLVIDRSGGPGSPVMPSIQGSDYRHAKILIDDIPLELLSEGIADLSTIPLENVERVEVLKGSASSVWGSSLGGVINIITRQPSDEPLAEIGASAGEEETGRYHAILSGKAGGVGYFLSGSRFETDGFFKNQDVESNNIYGKLTKSLSKALKAEISYGHNNTDRGFGEFPGYGSSEGKSSDSYGRVKLTYVPDRDLEASLSLYRRYFYGKREDTLTGDVFPFNVIKDREDASGAILKTGWRHSDKGSLSAGAETIRGELDFDLTNTLFSLTDELSKEMYRNAFYANESYGFGNLNFNIGIRYDEDSVFGSETSPSAGIVYNIRDASTLLRLNVARGFTPPPLSYRFASIPPFSPNPDLEAERSWTYQAGLESGYFKHLWGRVTFYRANVTDAVDLDLTGMKWKNFKEFRREGVEAEVRTEEYRGVSLSYGYAFNDVRNLEDNSIVKNKARITHDVGIDYRGPFETKATIKGRYVWWNSEKTPPYNAKDRSFIWDARVSKYLARWKGVMGEIFLSAHNITDEKQYLMEIYPNPGRWFEGGVSLTFY
jgi:vitamin B12 transporter